MQQHMVSGHALLHICIAFLNRKYYSFSGYRERIVEPYKLLFKHKSEREYAMSLENNYISDIEEILSHRYDHGGDYWATPDKRLLKGAPFTTIESPLYLLELGISADDPVMRGTANLIFST